MDSIEKDQFPAYFNGLSYSDVVGRLARHLPPDLHYDVEATPLGHGCGLHIIFRGCVGGKDGEYAVYFQQRINLSAKTAAYGDMMVHTEYQQQRLGTFLSYNNTLLRRDLGVEKSAFSAEMMGAYTWARMGTLVDTANDDGFRMEKWVHQRDKIATELIYLRGRLGLSAVDVNLTTPDCLWPIADMDFSGFLDQQGFFRDRAPAHFEWDDVMEARLTARACLMLAAHDTNPQHVTIGQLILYDKKIPSMMLLQEHQSDLAERQWDRIRNYMRAKGYPDLQP